MQQYTLTKNALQKAKTILATSGLKALISFLQKYKLNEYEHDFIALQTQWNVYYKKTLHDVIDREDKTGNRLIEQFLDLLNLLTENILFPSSFHLPPKNTALPLANGVLLGREKELTAIHEALQQDNAFVMVQGFGGLGKSTVLLHYCYMDKYEAEYPEKLWIRVWDGEKGIQNALVAYFRERIDIKEVEIDAAFARVLAHLKEYEKGCLLILDNANESTDLLACINPLQATNWKVLVSTRCETGHIPTVAIKPVSLQDAQEIFLFYLTNKTALIEQCRKDPVLPQLLNQIDKHTLVIEILAKTLLKNPTATLKDFLAATQKADFQAKPFDTKLHHIAHQKYSDLTQHELKAAQYLAEIFPLTHLSAAELQILLYFSILPAQPYPFTVENRNFEKLHENPICLLNLFDVEETAEAEAALADTLMALVEKGLLQDEGIHAYYCHPVLHYAIHQHTQPSYENCEVVVRGVFKIVEWDSYTNKILLSDRLPIVEHVLMYIQEDTKQIAGVYNNSASIYKGLGNYEKALEYALESVRIAEKISVNDDENLATAYSNIAITYRMFRDYDKALEFALKAIAIREKIFSDEHPDLAISYIVLADIYSPLGNYEKELEYVLKATTIFEKIYSIEHPYLASSYNHVVVAYQNLGDYNKALEYNLKAIAIREKILSVEHPDLVISYSNIAITYYYLQKWDLALENEKKAILIWIKALPNGHPDIKIMIDNMKYILAAAIEAEGEEKYAGYWEWFEGLQASILLH